MRAAAAMFGVVFCNVLSLRRFIPVADSMMVASSPAPQREPGEKERVFAQFREGSGDGNPYAWDFDLCSLTLGNFNYRKMTLVRDYTRLIETDMAARAKFEAAPGLWKPTRSAPISASRICRRQGICANSSVGGNGMWKKKPSSTSGRFSRSIRGTSCRW